MSNKKLNSILNTMNIPNNNRDITNIRNVHWLIRNIGIHNAQHPQLQDVMMELKQMARIPSFQLNLTN